MSSVNYSGAGEALLVSEKCDSFKPFTAKTTFTTSSNRYLFDINYENSIVGKQALSGLAESINSYGIFSSTTALRFRFTFFVDLFGVIFLVTQITGDYKKCNYSSIDLQEVYDPSVESKEVNNHFKSSAKSADEFTKLLKSNASLNKMYLKLKAK
jgi:hypothetical protein